MPPHYPIEPLREQDHDSLGSIFVRFLKFGALAWGGPVAQIEMIKRECVDELGWVGEESFRKTLAVYQVLPGPEAHELCVYFGRLRGGKAGGFLAGLGFMLPGFLLMLALTVLYVEAGISESLDEVFYGLKAAVGALVARALVRLGRAFLTDLPLVLLAVGGFVLTLTGSLSFVLVLAAAGIAYELWTNAERWRGRAGSFSPAPLALAVVAGAITLSLTAEIFVEGLKAGLLTFGGAYTVIPFLQESSVDAHRWLSDEQFVDGLAMSGVLPAPLIIFSTFVGYLAGGLGGGLMMTLGIFLPAFILPIFLHRQLVALADNPRVRPLLLGVAAGVIGLIAAVVVEIVKTSVVDVPTALLAIGAFAALHRFHSKLTVIPIRSEEGRPIRSCFVAREGCKLVALDYNQVELRVLAHVAEEEALREIFASGEDVHTATAAEVLDLEPGDVGPAERSKAKMVNYGIVYGLSAFGLSDRLGIDTGEAAEYINRYFNRFPAVRAFIDATIELAREQGFVTTLLGRRRNIGELRARNPQTRSLGERLAVNTVVQGTAADIIKIAMVGAHAAVAEAGLESRLVLQIHDELLFEVPEGEVDAVTKLATDQMVGAFDLDPPLAVDVGIGDNWLEAK